MMDSSAGRMRLLLTVDGRDDPMALLGGVMGVLVSSCFVYNVAHADSANGIVRPDKFSYWTIKAIQER